MLGAGALGRYQKGGKNSALQGGRRPGAGSSSRETSGMRSVDRLPVSGISGRGHRWLTVFFRCRPPGPIRGRGKGGREQTAAGLEVVGDSPALTPAPRTFGVAGVGPAGEISEVSADSASVRNSPLGNDGTFFGCPGRGIALRTGERPQIAREAAAIAGKIQACLRFKAERAFSQKYFECQFIVGRKLL